MTTFTREDSGLAGNNIADITGRGTGRCGSPQRTGTSRMVGGRFEAVPLGPGSTRSVQCVFAAEDGAVWTGRPLYRIRGTNIDHFIPARNSPPPRSSRSPSGTNGSLWLRNRRGGLIRPDGHRFQM